MAQNNKVLVDYHAHSSWSDGHSNIVVLVKAANDKGLEVVAATDHDDCRALSARNVEDNKLDLRGIREVSPGVFEYNGTQVVRGVELSCNDGGVTRHILGLYIDEPCDELMERFAMIRNGRIDRIKLMIGGSKRYPGIARSLGISDCPGINGLSEIKSRNIVFDAEQILMDIVSEGVPSRLHAAVAIAREYEKIGETITPWQALETYLGSNSPAYVSLNAPVFPSPREGIETILRLNGLPVLPHLIELERSGADIRDKIVEYVSYGLVGFEVISGRRTALETDMDYRWLTQDIRIDSLRISIPDQFKSMAALNGQPLIPFFGSDYHGQYIPERTLGVEVDERDLRTIRNAYSSITR